MRRGDKPSDSEYEAMDEVDRGLAALPLPDYVDDKGKPVLASRFRGAGSQDPRRPRVPIARWPISRLSARCFVPGRREIAFGRTNRTLFLTRAP